MNETTTRTLGNVLLALGVLGFVAGSLLVVLGTPIETPLIALAALALMFVGAGSAMKNRGRPDAV